MGAGLIFEVRGIPAPQGSKRHMGNGVMVESAGQKLKSWREAVRAECVAAMLDTGTETITAGPVAVTATFLMPRPKSHYRTGKHSGVLRDDAPRYVDKRPDIDKLVRATLDALRYGGAYMDDSQVARFKDVEMVYATPPLTMPGAVIVVRAA